MRVQAFACGLSYLLVGALAIACGDDEDSSDGGPELRDSGTGGSGGAGGRPMLPEAGTGGRQDGGSGDGEEGFPCATTAHCGLDSSGNQLTCVDSGGFPYGICARGCERDQDCGGELCVSYTGLRADAHCLNLVNQEFAECGVGVTSDCNPDSGLTCLYLPDLPIGVCTTLCASGAGDDDAGTVDPVCRDGQFCRGGIVVDNGSGVDGVCGTRAARGETCGIFEGSFCGEGDVCAPDDVNDEDSTFSCHQSCSAVGSTCDTGECRQYQRVFFCQ